jgi:8-oxo-dGTP pyrophosphatase MutT (NUDIX family)
MNRLEEELNRPGTRRLCPGVFVVREGKFLTALRYYTKDPTKKQDLWTIPGGRCEEGETVGQCVLREASEEAGLTAIKFIAYIGEVAGAHNDDLVPLFVGVTAEEPQYLEPEKFSDWVWADPDDFVGPFINPPALAILAVWMKDQGEAI